MKNKKGFTLIELLVVIAIIGILAAIAMVNLNSARIKARVASAKGTLNALQPVAVLCLDGNGNITSTNNTAVCNGSAAPTVGNVVCSNDNNNTWPALPTGGGSWAYGNCNSNQSAGTWTIAATGDSCTITCSQSGCSYSGC